MLWPRLVLVAAALAPALFGLLPRLWWPRATAGGVILHLALMCALALAAAIALHRLAAAGAVALTPAAAVRVGQWRVAAIVTGVLPVWVAGLRVPVSLAMVLADIAFWAVVLLAVAPRAGRRLSAVAAALYAAARTSSLAPLVLTDDAAADAWGLGHRIAGTAAALAVSAVLLCELWRTSVKAAAPAPPPQNPG